MRRRPAESKGRVSRALAELIPSDIHVPNEDLRPPMITNRNDPMVAVPAQPETENALCKKTLEGLKELGLEMGDSFYPELLETFEQDAVAHLAALRAAIAEGDT